MNKYKVCVYAICKNEEKFVDRWMDSMSEADMIVVADTGSSDETVAKLKKKGAVVYSIEVNPWRFDVARNISLSKVPDDMDICVCTDLDEVFLKGWRKELEKAWVPDAKMAHYMFNWSLKPDGTPDTQFLYFKVHTKNDYIWAYPVHECLKYIGVQPEKKVYADGMILNHYPDSTKSRGAYLELLETAIIETPLDDRITYYLGREYMYTGQWEQCVRTLKRHLSLSTALWKEERCASMRWIARSYYEMNNVKEAYEWFYNAIEEAPWMRDPYVEFAKTAYELGDWASVYIFSKKALHIKEKSKSYANLGYCWDFTPDDLAAIGSYRLGFYEEALNHAKIARKFAPEDERLQNNIVLIENKIREIKELPR